MWLFLLGRILAGNVLWTDVGVDQPLKSGKYGLERLGHEVVVELGGFVAGFVVIGELCGAGHGVSDDTLGGEAVVIRLREERAAREWIVGELAAVLRDESAEVGEGRAGH